MMRSTGETAFVGFGSSVVRSSGNQAVQAKLNLDAQKIAGMRSKDVLCGLIIGDKSTWEGSVKESLKDQVQEFEGAADGDPLAKDSPAGVKKLAEAKQTLISKLESTDAYQSVAKRHPSAGREHQDLVRRRPRLGVRHVGLRPQPFQCGGRGRERNARHSDSPAG